MEESIVSKNLEKQKQWDDIMSRVKRITDGLGKHVDRGIEETMAAFLANGFITTGSCEGHLNRGVPYPWIMITHKLDSVEFKAKVADLTKRVELKGYTPQTGIPESDTELHSEAMELGGELGRYKKTVETKIKSVLADFYNYHNPVSDELTLFPWKGGSFFYISPISGKGIGVNNRKKFEEKIKLMSDQEKENYLKNAQTEMNALTEFLKNRFFNSN